MRAHATLLLCFLATASVAHAQGARILVLTEDASLQSALQLSLAGRGAELSVMPAPEGALRLDRAAFVQHAAVESRAMAGVWIEIEQGSAEVCVVSADGTQVRHAPLASASPRVFAAIATSLLDEMLLPGDLPGMSVDVHVDVSQPPPRVARDNHTDFAALATPSMMSLATPEQVVRSHHTLIEVGPMLSPLSAGVEAEVAFPIAEQYRFGVLGGLNALFDRTNPLFFGGLELRHVGRGTSHWDFGLLAGGATAEGDGVGFAGVRIGHVWEGVGHGLEWTISPVILFGGGAVAIPGAWSSLRWELPI